jgi:hypothetical protein
VVYNAVTAAALIVISVIKLTRAANCWISASVAMHKAFREYLVGIQAMLKTVFSREPGGRLQGFLYF